MKKKGLAKIAAQIKEDEKSKEKDISQVKMKFKVGTLVWFFNPRNGAREIWTVQLQQVELGQAYYGIIKDGELRESFEGGLEEWIDYEALQKKADEWEKQKLSCGDVMYEMIECKIKETSKLFCQGSSKDGDYLRHLMRWSSNKADYALFTYGKLYDSSLSFDGASQKMLSVCDPEIWRENWKTKLKMKSTFTDRKFPNLNESKAAIGPLDDRFGDPDPLFAPLPPGGEFDYLNSERAQETTKETFEQWKQKEPRVPTGNHRRNIYILPMEELPNRIMTKIIAYLKAFFFNIYVSELECPPLETLHVRHRQHEGHGNIQYHVQDVHDCLKHQAPSDCFLMLIITMEDLYDDEKWNFSLGKEFKESFSAVISLARYDPGFWRKVEIPSEYVKDINVAECDVVKPPKLVDGYLQKWRLMHRVEVIKKKWNVKKKTPPEVRYESGSSKEGRGIQKYTDIRLKKKIPLLGNTWKDRIRYEDDWEVILRRACKALSKEAVHACGVQHCLFYNCLMNGSIHLREFDKKTMHLCPVCLHKHMAATGIHSTFRCTERYVELKDWFKINKPFFHYEAKFVETREYAIERAGEKAYSRSLVKKK